MIKIGITSFVIEISELIDVCIEIPLISLIPNNNKVKNNKIKFKI